MPPIKRNQPRPAAANPNFNFVGRANQVAQFRDSVRYMLGTAPAPPDRHFTHLFIAHGEGGMGKSWLLRRWRDVAVEEGVPASRVISIPLDGHSYPTTDALAGAIREAIAINSPNFDRNYQASHQRRTNLQDRYKELSEEWQRYTALRDSGKLSEVRKAARQNLAHAETQRSKSGSLHETTPMFHQAEDSLSRLRSFERFEGVNAKAPASLEELLCYELGTDDAALFSGEDRWSATALGADLCRLAEDEHTPINTLVLSIDTYELADQHDDWLRALVLEAGDHILTLIGGRNPIHRRDGHQRDFSDDLQTYVQTFDLGREVLNRTDIHELIALIIERDATDTEIDEVARLSQGVPLAVRQLAEHLRENGNLDAYHDLSTGELDNNSIVRAITTRFLSYVIEEQREESTTAERKQRERLRIQTLAIPTRADEELMCALWGVDERDVVRVNRELRSAHSFVYAGENSYGMHDLVRQFVRADMWGREPEGWLQIRQGLERASALLQQRLDHWKGDSPERQFDNTHWRNATLNQLNLLLWLRQFPDARRLLLETWVAARYYHLDMAKELESLAVELAPGTSEWRRIISAIRQSQSDNYPHRRDYQSLEPYLAQLSDHAKVLWYVGQGDQIAVFRVRNEKDKLSIEQAIDFYKEALLFQPDWRPLRSRIGHCYSSMGYYHNEIKNDWQLAIEFYTLALDFNNNNPIIFFNIAFCHSRLERYHDSIKYYDEAINLDPEYADAFSNRGVTKRRLGDYEGAISDYSTAISITPNHAHAFNNRGLAYEELFEYRQAIDDYQKAILIDPDYIAAYTNLGDAYRKITEFTKAIKSYKKSLKINPNDLNTLVNLGTLYYEMNEFNKAIRSFQHALEQHPNDEDAHNNLAYMYSLSGEREKSKYHYQEALKKNSDYFWSLLGLARIAAEEGDLATKRRYLVKAQRLLKKDEEFYQRACFESIAGRTDRALKNLEIALKKGQHSQAWARQDPAFAPIAQDPRFRALVGMDTTA